MENNNLIGIVLGLVFLGLMIWYFYSLGKKYKRPLGEILNYKAVYNNETFLMLLTFGTYTSEAMTAANVQIAGEGMVAPNILARMVLHLMISFGGWLCELTVMRDFSSVFEKPLELRFRIVRIVIFSVVAYLAIRVPFWNVELIAANLGQSMTYDLYIYSIMPWHSWQEVSEMCELVGYPPNYSPWANMQPILQASYIATWITILYAFVSGLRNVSSQERATLLFTNKLLSELEKEKSDKPKDERTKEERVKDPDKLLDNLEFLLRRLYSDKEKAARLAKIARSNYKKYNDTTTEPKMSTRMLTLVNMCKEINADKWEKYGDSKSAANEKVENMIRDFFQGPVEDKDLDKRGLGITVKKWTGRQFV